MGTLLGKARVVSSAGPLQALLGDDEEELIPASMAVRPPTPLRSVPIVVDEEPASVVAVPASNPLLTVRPMGFYGLPPAAEAIFRRRGVKSLYDWQDHVLTREDVLRGRNFVYSLPTSGGKTLVAEVILLRTLVEQRKSVMFVLPFVALAEEKVHSLREFEDALGIRVEGYYGTVGRNPPPMAPTAFVCTMEKANSLYNTLHDEGRAQGEVGCVVVDELHMIGDGRRGAILELLLTKIRVVSKGSTQIVGMSATVPNLDQIAAWLGAACYVGTFRPVPLREHIVCGGDIIPKESVEDPCRNPRNRPQGDDHEAIVRIITEHPESSSIVFCASRGQCAEYSQRLVRTMQRMGLKALAPGKQAAAEALVKELEGSGQESYNLVRLIPFGVAYHNGGLSMEEREIVEKGFKNKIITVLCATSTLAAGVNLPARRVVFKTPFVGRDFLRKSQYMQMCGRAGRAGLDAHGESYLVVTKRDFNRGVQLVNGLMEPIRSAVFSEKHSFARMLLESIGVGMLHQSNRRVYDDLFPPTPDSSIEGAVGGSPSARGSVLIESSLIRLWSRCLLCHSTSQSMPVARVHDAIATLGRTDLFDVPLTPSRLELTPGGGFRGKVRKPSGAEEVSPELEVDTLPPQPQGSAGALVELRDGDSCSLPAEEGANVDEAAEGDAGDGCPVMLSLPEVGEHFQLDPVELLVKAAIAVLVETGMVMVAASETGPTSPHCSQSITWEVGRGEGSMSFELTPFGASAVRSCFEVDEAVLVRDELLALQEKGVILSNDLHICYFLTPFRGQGDFGTCDWGRYVRLLSCMPDIRQNIANSIGINFGAVHQYAMGLIGLPQPKATGSPSVITAEELVDPQVRQLFSLQRFYVALCLCDILNEVPSAVVEERYSFNYGQQQAMLRSASIFSSSIVSFCAAMGWHNLEALFAAYVKRLGFGVKADLLPLMEIPGVKAAKARALWTAGLRKPSDIAVLTPEAVYKRVKERCGPDSKSAKFFSVRSAVAVVREANKVLQRALKEKKGELQDMEAQVRMHGGNNGQSSPSGFLSSAVPSQSWTPGGSFASNGLASAVPMGFGSLTPAGFSAPLPSTPLASPAPTTAAPPHTTYLIR